jgi:hypothetical protein
MAIGAYAISGVISLVLGTIYVTASQFLPYHRDAIGADWNALDTGTQAVLRALVHVGGAGWLACGIALLVLAWIPVRRGERWALWATPVIGLAFWVPNVWATVEVTVRSAATAPWYGSVVAVGLLVAGAAASAVDARRRVPSERG